MRGFQQLWEELRREGKQTARYPYDKVISFVFRYHPKQKERSEVHILEVGCGAGNNLWTLAMEGFKVYGIDGSETAISLAKDTFKKLGLQGEFTVGDFTSRLPYPDNFFDLVIDRGSITCVDYEDAKSVVSEVRRVLKQGGYFFFNPYAKTHTSYTTSSNKLNDRFVLTEKGPIAGTGYVCFYDKEDVTEIIKEGWEILELKELSLVNHTDGSVHGEWEVVAKKL
ncbi:MAG: class I SAM-dependent methyltransferase [Hydrogenobacter thermophilus]|nr:class I SAM-dependent methyltransferase [Hydrogenobacter thermophilus]